MIEGAWLSVLGLYNYDNSLFDKMVVPQRVDKQLLIDNLLIELAELEVIYPNWIVMQTAIGRWSQMQLRKWQELEDTMYYDYNPIENYRRNEGESYSGVKNVSDKDKETRSLSEERRDDRNLNTNSSFNGTNNQNGSVTLNDNTNNYVYGFNSPTLALRNNEQETGNNISKSDSKDVNSSNVTETGNIAGRTTHNDTIDNNRNIWERDGNERAMLAYGNIGVTTTQQMITEQRDVVEFNIYDYIIADFKKRFCLQVW